MIILYQYQLMQIISTRMISYKIKQSRLEIVQIRFHIPFSDFEKLYAQFQDIYDTTLIFSQLPLTITTLNFVVTTIMGVIYHIASTLGMLMLMASSHLSYGYANLKILQTASMIRYERKCSSIILIDKAKHCI